MSGVDASTWPTTISGGAAGEAVDFVEDDHSVGPGGEKPLGVIQQCPRAREFAVELVGVGQGLSQGGLADALDTHQPDDGAELPRTG